jgi:hypothetical protein
MARVAFRAIRSRRAFINAPQVRKVLEAAMDGEVKPHFIGEFEKRVANWKHKPAFKARKYITGDAIRLNVYPAGEKQIYEYVTKGTRGPYPIPKIPKPPGKWLLFTGGKYTPRTTPGGGYGGPGISIGFPVFAKQVSHPGIEPRDFEGIIRKEQAPWFSRTMENAWRRAIRSMSTS